MGVVELAGPLMGGRRNSGFVGHTHFSVTSRGENGEELLPLLLRSARVTNSPERGSGFAGSRSLPFTVGLMEDIGRSEEQPNYDCPQCVICKRRLEFRIDRTSGQALLVQDCPSRTCREVANHIAMGRIRHK